MTPEEPLPQSNISAADLIAVARLRLRVDRLVLWKTEGLQRRGVIAIGFAGPTDSDEPPTPFIVLPNDVIRNLVDDIPETDQWVEMMASERLSTLLEQDVPFVKLTRDEECVDGTWGWRLKVLEGSTRKAALGGNPATFTIAWTGDPGSLVPWHVFDDGEPPSAPVTE